ncbi:hypothetical protein Tco_0421320 [Tanacetum coccineum]
MVISSPCLTDIKNWLVQKQMAFGKDFSNLFTAHSLLKTIWFLTHHALHKELASLKQMALGKYILNPLRVGSLLKTIWLSVHHVIAMKHSLFQSKRLLKKPPRKGTRTITPPVTSTSTTPMTDAAIRALIDRGVADALCTYSDFLKCQPLNFKGTEGIIGLTQWFERMESVFHISNCAVENQVKFATCTLYGIALTWWNTHVKTVGHDAAYSMP